MVSLKKVQAVGGILMGRGGNLDEGAYSWVGNSVRGQWEEPPGSGGRVL